MCGANMNARGDEEAAWRAFPIYTTMKQEELESRMAAGLEPESPEEYILRVRYVTIRNYTVAHERYLNKGKAMQA
jgi:hypothetical protein